MLRLNEHRSQASNRFAIALCRCQVLLPKTNRQFRYRQMQIASGRSFEYLAAQNRSLAEARGFRRKYHNVEFRREGGYKPHILAQLSEKRQRCLPSAFQPAREFASLFQRQQSLRRPQGRRSRPRTGALQAYLAQVQFRGTEISVGRIMLVQSAHSGIAKEHAAAPVGLQSVFVRIDDNRVRFSNLCNCPLRIFSEVFRKHEIAAVRGIGVNPESLLCTQSENLRQRIHRTCRRGTHRRDNRPHVAAPQALRQRIYVHPALRIAGHAFEWQLQNTADPPMRIVSLFAGENFLSRLQLSRHPQGLEIRHRSATARVAQKILPTEHAGDLCDCLFFHRRGGPPTIQRVIVRIDPHGQRIRQPGHWVRRLQHLSRVQWMKIGIVILQSLGRRVKHFGKTRHPRRLVLKSRQSSESVVELSRHFREQAQTFQIKHHQSPVTSHFFTAKPYPIAPPSLAIPTAPAVSENLHPDTPSTFRSLPAWPFRLHANSIFPRQTAIETRPHFAARAAIPAAPLLLPHPSRAPAASSAGLPRSIRFSCFSR